MAGCSTGGYHIFMQGGIVDSAMTFLTPLALSSTEAEYNNASAASTDVASMSMLMQDLKCLSMDIPLKIPLLIDNKACILMGEKFCDSKHTQHILRCFHYICYMLDQGFFTKGLEGTAPTYMLFRALGEVRLM
jgi:hypothetical protein